MKRLCLLTGVTGFIGAAVAAQWLTTRPIDELLLLVRAPSAHAGLTRARESIGKFLDDPKLLDRLTTDNILLGDYISTLALLQDPRINQVTQVINSAAIATFGSNKDIWPVNVEGPLQLARKVMTNPGFTRFVQVGTAMCCGPLSRQTVQEDYLAPPGTEHIVPYTESKVEVEQRLASELPSLPLVIARPSIVIGHSRLGCIPSPSLFWIFRLARALKTFTCDPTDVVDVVPVDFVASSLLVLAEAPQLQSNKFHISAGAQYINNFEQIDDAVAQGLSQPSLKEVYRKSTLKQIQELSPQFPQLIGPCVDFVVMRAIELYGQFAAMSLTFDNSRLIVELNAAQARGVPDVLMPMSFAQYAGKCAQTAEGTPIFEQMRFDFKGYSPTLIDRVMARLFG